MPGEAARFHPLDVSQGIEALRHLIAQLRGTGDGIVLVGRVGVTSHLGDLLRRARFPSRIEEGLLIRRGRERLAGLSLLPPAPRGAKPFLRRTTGEMVASDVQARFDGWILGNCGRRHPVRWGRKRYADGEVGGQ